MVLEKVMYSKDSRDKLLIGEQGNTVDEGEPVQLTWRRDISTDKYRHTYPLPGHICMCSDRSPPNRKTGSVRRAIEISAEDLTELPNV